MAKQQVKKKLEVGRLASRRAGLSSASADWVRCEPLFEEKAIPLLVRPAVADVDLVAWASQNRDHVEQLLRRHRAVLFRGFGIRDAGAFGRFVEATSDGPLLEYRDRSTPRLTRGERIYTSTVYPAEQRINLHNEGTYWRKWARKIYFCCVTPARQGGETPIADVARVCQRIASSIRREFERSGVMYVRNYNDGFGLPWQEVFQTESRAEVESYCHENDISFEWKEGDRLRTRQVRPAVRRHPVSNEPLWFNHGAFFHVSALEPAVRATLLTEFAEEDLPYNTYYGDGRPIDPATVAHVLEAYRQEQVAFPWELGDVLLQDNMAVAHGREPFKGEREVLTAMTEPFSKNEDEA